MADYSSSWIVNISASLALSFWELVWRPRTIEVESLRYNLEAAEREKTRQEERERKRNDKQRRNEERAEAKAAKEYAREQLKLAKQEHKLQKAIEKQKTKELKNAETKDARKSVNQTLKRKRKIEIIPDSEPEDEIPIYSAKDLRDQRASK